MTCCLSQPPTPKFSLMVWGCINFYGVGTITVVDGNINAQRYIGILEAHLQPVVQHFPEDNYIYQDDNAPVHCARIVQDYKRENMWLRLKREFRNGDRHLNLNLKQPFEGLGKTLLQIMSSAYIGLSHEEFYKTKGLYDKILR